MHLCASPLASIPSPFYETRIGVKVFIEGYTSTRLSPVNLVFLILRVIQNGDMLSTVFGLL